MAKKLDDEFEDFDFSMLSSGKKNTRSASEEAAAREAAEKAEARKAAAARAQEEREAFLKAEAERAAAKAEAERIAAEKAAAAKAEADRIAAEKAAAAKAEAERIAAEKAAAAKAEADRIAAEKAAAAKAEAERAALQDDATFTFVPIDRAGRARKAAASSAADDDFDFDDIDITSHKAAPMEETDEDAMASQISASLNKAADEYPMRQEPDPEPVDDDDDYYYEEEKPARRGLFGRKKAAKPEPEDEDYEEADYEEEEDEDYEDEEPHKGGILKIILFAIFGIAVVAVLAAGVSILVKKQQTMNFYRSHFLPGTTINGIDCSDMSVDDVAAAFENVVKDYSLEVKGIDDTAVLTNDDASMAMSIDLDFQDLLDQQDHSAYETSAETPENYTIDTAISVDEEALRKKIEALPMFTNMTPSSSCSLEFNVSTGQYVLNESVHGDEVDLTKVEKRIIECFKTLKSDLDLQEEGFYPEVVDATDEVRQSVETMNMAVTSNISLNFGDAGNETVPQLTIRNCLKLNDQMVLEFDATSLKSWISQQASTYDTYGGTHDFHTTTGYDITVSGGNYGWQMDQDATEKLVEEAVLSGESKVIDPVYSHEGASHGTSDIGSTYVEVNLNNQTMNYYRNGVLILSTDVISGDVKTQKMTSTGVYEISALESNKTMTIGGTERTLAHWIPYYDGYGICDAAWRTSFGGEIYVTDGTFGSIYISSEAAATLSSSLTAGTPVVIFGGKTTYVEPTTKAATKASSATSATKSNSSTSSTRSYRSSTTAADSATAAATEAPTDAPTEAPTAAPTEAPTSASTEAPAPTAAEGQDGGEDG